MYAHDWLKGEVLRDSFACLLIQVQAYRMNSPYQRDFRVFPCEIDHASSALRGDPYQVPTGDGARDGHCSFQCPEALARSSWGY